jgi:phosphoesterase RecJ-like protein
MKMMLTTYKIGKLREMLSGAPKKVVVVSHYNPDGDAIGSSLAWGRTLEDMGHSVTCIVPNKYPYFLDWIEGIERIKIFSEHRAEVEKAVAEAELICCLDFNAITRLEGLTSVIEGNTTAQKLLIDHHLQPDADYFDLTLSYPEASSTSYIVYKLIARLVGTEAMSTATATALYVGMMTDTGNFSFSHLSPDLFRTVAVLVEKGIDIPLINQQIYNSHSEDRVRLLSYATGPKMELLQKKKVALISLTESELRRFHFRQGDSEGFVNYPLSIKGVQMSAMLLENSRSIRVSLRSRGDVDVNLFARKYFDGGGHKNAAGGKSHLSMEDTIAHYKKSVEEFFRNEVNKKQ